MFHFYFVQSSICSVLSTILFGTICHATEIRRRKNFYLYSFKRLDKIRAMKHLVWYGFEKDGPGCNNLNLHLGCRYFLMISWILDHFLQFALILTVFGQFDRENVDDMPFLSRWCGWDASALRQWVPLVIHVTALYVSETIQIISMIGTEVLSVVMICEIDGAYPSSYDDLYELHFCSRSFQTKPINQFYFLSNSNCPCLMWFS